MTIYHLGLDGDHPAVSTSSQWMFHLRIRSTPPVGVPIPSERNINRNVQIFIPGYEQDIPWILLGFWNKKFQDAAAVHAQLSGVQARSEAPCRHGMPWSDFGVMGSYCFFWSHLLSSSSNHGLPHICCRSQRFVGSAFVSRLEWPKIWGNNPRYFADTTCTVKRVCLISFILFGKVLHI